MNIGPLSFDEWAELYRADPQAFEKKRWETLTSCAASAPAHRQKAMVGLLNEILDDQDATRGNPDATMTLAFKKMAESLEELDGALRSVARELQNVAHPKNPQNSASHLPKV